MTAIEFNSQFRSLQNKLLPCAYKLTNNVEDAKDLLQETALRAFHHKDKFETGTNFKAWVTTIMRNTFINSYRKNKNRNTTCEPSDSFVFVNENHSVDNCAPSNLTLSELNSILNRLDSIYRQPFVMFFEGFKYEEIAEKMNLPVGTVKSRIFIARQKLMEHINLRYNYHNIAALTKLAQRA